MLFCHGRISAAGNVRLVTVFADGSAVIWNGDKAIPTQWWEPAFSAFWAKPFRVFAGQPDPADPAHFTIEFDDPAGKHGVIDGRLSDNDTLTLTDINVSPAVASHP